MRPVLGLDLDGVVRDWGGSLHREWELQTRQTLPLPTTWNLRESYPHPTRDIVELAFGTHAVDVQSYAPCLPGAKAGVQALQAAGIKVVFLTAQPNAACRRLTQHWLYSMGFDYDGLVFVNEGESKVDALEADLYVDDGPHNIADFIAARVPYLIMDALYNQHCAGDRVRTWQELLPVILSELSLPAGKALV